MSSRASGPPQGLIAALACAGIVSVLASVFWYNGRNYEAHKSDQATGLQRAGAIRRPRRSAQPQSNPAGDGNGTELDGAITNRNGPVITSRFTENVEESYQDATVVIFEDENGTEHTVPIEEVVASADNETEHTIPDEDAAQVAENENTQSKLKELTYFIAQNREFENGVEHRGIMCDSCHIKPIRGIRYRCANCEDYDLCELCEATSEHPRTHVFYKIRVPCFWGPGKAEPLWYPGTPTKMPTELPDESLQSALSSYTVAEYGHAREADEREEAVVKGLYLQFTCLADTRLPNSRDRDSIGYGISKGNFRYLLPVTKRGALVFNRLFAIFDLDNDGLISFQEFVAGASLINFRREHPKYRELLFKAWDIDEDGFVGRQDLLSLFTSMHEIAEDISVCHLGLYNESDDQKRVYEGRTLRDHVESTKPLPNFFSTAYFDHLHHHRQDAPIFGQLTGSTTSDDVDIGLGTLFEGDPPNEDDEPEAVDELNTPAAAYIRERLLDSFNEVLDPIFSEYEKMKSFARERVPLRNNYSPLLKELRKARHDLALKVLADDLRTARVEDTATNLPRTLPRDHDELYLLNHDWSQVGTKEGFDPIQIYSNTLHRIHEDPYDRQRLVQELRTLADRYEQMDYQSFPGAFDEILIRQKETVWNPTLRHNTLDIYPGLLFELLNEMVCDDVLQDLTDDYEKGLKGLMDEKLFWFWTEKAATEHGIRDVVEYVPMLDVLGLIVI